MFIIYNQYFISISLNNLAKFLSIKIKVVFIRSI
jgi:hypothetical protein